MSAREIYENTIRQLPAMDRLRLASLILEDLTVSGGNGLDLSDEWSDQDIADLNAASLHYAARSIPVGDTDA